MVVLGYAMVYGILGLINFAHGEVVMVGAMVALSVSQLLIESGLPLPLILLISLIASIVVCMALGYGIERIAYRPLRKAPRLAPLNDGNWRFHCVAKSGDDVLGTRIPCFPVFTG